MFKDHSGIFELGVFLIIGDILTMRHHEFAFTPSIVQIQESLRHSGISQISATTVVSAKLALPVVIVAVYSLILC